MTLRAFCTCHHNRTAHVCNRCSLCACASFTLAEPAKSQRPPHLSWYEAELLNWVNREVRPYLDPGGKL